MKTYQTLMAGLLLLATSLGFGSKQDSIKLPKLMPKSEYSEYFKNEGLVGISTTHQNNQYGLSVAGAMNNVGDLFIYKEGISRDIKIEHIKNLGNGQYKHLGDYNDLESALKKIGVDYCSGINGGDMDGDGDLDLLVAWQSNTGVHSINYIEGDGDKYIDRGTITTIENPSYSMTILIGYNDSNKTLDLLVIPSNLLDKKQSILIENNLPQKN